VLGAMVNAAKLLPQLGLEAITVPRARAGEGLARGKGQRLVSEQPVHNHVH
jgi:hypothetical protein